LGIAYKNLGQYQQAIEFYQQQLNIAREIGDRRGEANSWYNSGLALEKLARRSDAIGAYRYAKECYQSIELAAEVQDCSDAINRLSQEPVIERQPKSDKRWLNRFGRWFNQFWHQIINYVRRLTRM
jgi:tetratricopeptide (TPR) repeat protein